MKKSNDVLILLFLFLQFIVTRLALADHYSLFSAYEIQPDGEQYQLKGYVLIQYSASSGASSGSLSHFQGNRYYVPVQNGALVSRDTLFKDKSVLLKNTKTASAFNQRESTGSGERLSSSSVASRGSAMNTGLITRHRSRRSGSQPDRQSSPAGNTPTCQPPVVNFVLEQTPGSVHFEWIQNQEAAPTSKGRLTITHDDGSHQVLENISHSGIHEFVIMSELGQVSEEDRWIMANCKEELTSDDLASLGRELKDSENQQLCTFKSAAAIPAMRSSCESAFPDPVWGTNCNWEHSAFYILNTGQVGWELINHSGEHQHVLMMPETQITPEIAGNFEELMGIVDESEMGIAIVGNTEAATSFPAQTTMDTTTPEESESTLSALPVLQQPFSRTRTRAASFTVRIGSSRRWQALTNPEFPNRDYYLKLIAASISGKIGISFERREELKASLYGQITQAQIEELIQLGIITRPENTGGTSPDNYNFRKGGDPDPDSGAAGGSTGGTRSAGGHSLSAVSSGESGAGKAGSATSGDKSRKRTVTSNSSYPVDTLFFPGLRGGSVLQGNSRCLF